MRRARGDQSSCISGAEPRTTRRSDRRYCRFCERTGALMQVAIVGTGYVGLVAGAALADSGRDVVCVDIDQQKIERLREGEVPIYEPGLEPLVKRNLAAGRLRFSTDVAGAVRDSDVIFIAVGTPQDEDGSADLQHVLAVARTIGQNMTSEKIVITKSTVPVGTAT